MNNKLFWELFFTITEILAKHSVGSKGFSEVA